MDKESKDIAPDATLPKRQRLSGTKAIEQLFRDGKGGFVYPFRYTFTTVTDTGARTESRAAAGEGRAAGAGESYTVPPDDPNGATSGTLRDAETAGNAMALPPDGAAFPEEGPDKGNIPGIPATGKGTECGSFRVLFSVPKRYHKRANKRNLLKRRSREAFRQAKQGLTGSVAPGSQLRVALIYSSREVEDYRKIDNAIRKIISQLRSAM
ncbi:MAG: ribonuclease P protein component [Rikenellaceae bacterium]|nr:ribonuclease P protein component [Rikenellaceae bacterium]